MNNPEDTPFSDLALYGMLILARDTKPVPLARLHAAMPMFCAAHFESALSRGWVQSHIPPRHSKDKGKRYTLTDAGTAHIRRLVEISRAVPAIV